MPLTTVVGSSGSGKTTFLNDLNDQSKCVYIRQYHKIRPYVTVSKIPNFDPSKLPYWATYEAEGVASTIAVGGTMAGEFTAGLSGGQRKLLLFELIVQRATQCGQQLLVVLDEPFAGVTDDFVPWIVERLDFLRQQKHNIVLVTNDHVQTLTELADNTITVSAFDRSIVAINQSHNSEREMVLHVLSSVGVDYAYPEAKLSDLYFFWDVEIRYSKTLVALAGNITFLFTLFLVSFWNSDSSSAATILVAGDWIAFFSVNPYLLSLVDWRHAVIEEAEALVHSSKSMNKLLKSMLVAFIIFCVLFLEYGVVNAVMSGLEDFKYMLGMFFDTGGTVLPYAVFGLYTSMSHQLVETLSLMPFLFMLLFSTTFSPGAGLPGVKELRYLFSRFYFWCMLPGIQDDMEGCPESEALNMFLLILTGASLVLSFVVWVAIKHCLRSIKKAKAVEHRDNLQKDEQFQALKRELFSEDKIKKPQPLTEKSEEVPLVQARSVSFSPSKPQVQVYKPTALDDFDC